MRCSYHPHQNASAYCTTCGHALCSHCDHRVKGYPHCPDCIVRGIELLRLQRYVGRPEQSPKRRGRPWRALLFGLIPGLGAIYNRQNAKAFLEFIGIVGLVELAEFTRVGVFGAMAAFLYLFSLLDAYRTATSVQSGGDPSVEDERLRRFLRAHVREWSVALMVLGALFAIVHIFGFATAGVLWRYLVPAALILLGLYLLRERYRSKASDAEAEAYANNATGHGPRSFAGPARLNSLVDASAKALDITPNPKRGK